ncbi:arginine--tRNA ligase [Lewinella cohaerens]|uniref:arginine--tRNA ligase n=1 Tax=Lewinella cohaerens TaxID=70995 RepID=UPI000365CFD5|nr:arginine--tRNA ligase [Lewinella cohaerens]
MANIIQIIQDKVSEAVQTLYQTDFPAAQVPISTTRKEFAGDYTVVVFPFTKAARKGPEAIAQELGEYLSEEVAEVAEFNVVKGFLNLVVKDDYWKGFLLDIAEQADYGKQAPNGQKVLVEFSSPNTNKPLHLGHIRNILLGWSTAQILEAVGYDVKKIQIINDRGIAICKSMLAWQKYGKETTPISTTTKPDHFVGKFYVLFEQHFKEEYKDWQATQEGEQVFADKAKPEEEATAFYKRYKNTYFNEYSQLGKEARELLLAWEAGDEFAVSLWKKMNNWVYAGFDITYEKLGVTFDKLYYESNTYLLGKEMVDKGLENKVFYTCEDGSVEADLSDAKLDKKKILRSDGTSLYVTQDLGTAHQRYVDFEADKMVYVVADEQNYHFQVLFELLKRLEEPYANGLYHLSYGMVDLPSGKMKSREGTVVDADDLIAEVVDEVRQNSQERDTLSDLTSEEQELVMHQVGLAALKYFITKVHPKKRMIFDPKESVDLQGTTGPYIQNAFVRIKSVLRKWEGAAASKANSYQQLEAEEKSLILQLFSFPEILLQAAKEYDPSTIAQYAYNLAKSYHKFYHDHSILKAESDEARDFRLALSEAVANSLEFSMKLLGIEMPIRM